jgi:hypothetical protein
MSLTLKDVLRTWQAKLFKGATETTVVGQRGIKIIPSIVTINMTVLILYPL